MDQLRGYALSSPEMDRLRGLRSQFSDARGDLCKRWTEEATPANRYFPALAKVYTSPIDAMQAFRKWIQLRPWMGLSISNCDGVRGRHGVDTPQGQSIEDDEFGELLIFDVNTTKTKLDHTGQQHDISHWETSYHGTGFYGLGNLITHGILASESEELGHGILDNTPGVYTSPIYGCAWGYATPHLMFDRERWFRVVVECLTNPEKRISTPKRK